jgi:hypothetical protein
MPSASTTECIVLAVAMPAQTPGPMIAFSAMSATGNLGLAPKRSPIEPPHTSSTSTGSPSISPACW